MIFAKHGRNKKLGASNESEEVKTPHDNAGTHKSIVELQKMMCCKELKTVDLSCLQKQC